MSLKQIVFILFPKVHLQDLAGAAQVFYEANQFGRQRFKIRFVSPVKEAVTSEQGLGFVYVRRRPDLCAWH
jgi:transcriptional regulator GlxA family with amidase domain